MSMKTVLLFVLLSLSFFQLTCKAIDSQNNNGEDEMSEKESAKGRTRKIEKTVEIAAPVADVWKAITQAEKLKQWFPLDAEVKPGVGGKVRISWGDKFVWEFRVDVWVEEEHLRLVYDHNTDFNTLEEPESQEMVLDAGQQLAVDYFLEARSGKTVLRLVHSGFGHEDSWDEEYDAVRRGWNSELMGLKHYVEHHFGAERSVAWANMLCAQPVELIWQKLMGDEGFVSEGSLKEMTEGDAYEVKASTGESFRGTIAYFNPPMDFVATAENLNNALLRVWIEEYRGKRVANVWLSAYGLPEAEVAEFQARWTHVLQNLFPASN
ncbi:SRPBCC domain-containing protein [candidate division KSB1 bacterium]|nr:SRPBCC domain-containing protein [candidate division KSB1 bacterium]NIR72305.1 SRPBCC domain-containing protein [candidate division KSB1 bacterium]NIS26697.1 SRPBCC domain-containing protein [candidate division KSB1 bacterium]NIT70333.1 SRPBCC domain-containing protein [candidate division KSB1 bacterium]NIU27312.1 SRPBCC domain-containing protein [candidate division KSB1 bacterium]